jgi:hypothetical protein
VKAIDLAEELDWFLPGALLTGALATFSLLEMPRYSGILPALLLLPLWMLAFIALAGVLAVPAVLRLRRQGVESPIAYCRTFLRENAKLLIFVTAGMLLAGLNMITFMWVKPLLNYLVPFSADPLLARADHFLFQTDPWRLLGWLNITPLAYFYHRGWFALMIVVLLKVLLSPSSPMKSAIMLSYFVLWSLFGPLVHIALPAGGPVFFATLGYGDRFSALVMEPETQRLSEYLWRVYSHQTFAGGAGISAMPSLHIATVAWMVIAVREFAPRWTLPISGAGLLIFLLSVSLGWHYAVDGIVGALGAYAVWRVCTRGLTLRAADTDAVAQIG